MSDCCDETYLDDTPNTNNHEKPTAINKTNVFMAFCDVAFGCCCLLPIILIGVFIIIGLFVAYFL